MQFTSLEIFITNSNFILLFFTMLFYLLQSASFISPKWSFLPNFGILISNFLQATFLGLRWFSSGHFPLSNLYESLLFLSWVLTSLLVFFNNQTDNFTPFAPLEKKGVTIKQNPRSPKIDLWSNLKTRDSSSKLISSFLGSILTPLILLINTFATFSLPTELKGITSLVPALKSNWLMMHVTLMILSYGALLCGCLLAIAFLIVEFFTFSPIKLSTEDNASEISKTNKSKLPEIQFAVDNFQVFKEINIKNEDTNKKKNKKKTFPEENLLKKKIVLPQNALKNQQKNLKLNFSSNLTDANSSFNEENLTLQILQPKQKNTSSSELAEILDNLSYRILGLGFPLLTIGILSGAVWANQTWGSYWSWDPKETWALITWFIFAIYLHTRISYGWTGTQSALIAAFGFILIWVCYLGVNLLGKGLHSYGFFN